MSMFQVGLTVTKANQYETASSTTEILSDSLEARELLSNNNSSQWGSTTSTVQTNVILKQYSVSKADIGMAVRQGILEQGRADPFAEVTSEPEPGNSGDTGSGNSGSGNGQASGNTTSGGSTPVSDRYFL